MSSLFHFELEDSTSVCIKFGDMDIYPHVWVFNDEEPENVEDGTPIPAHTLQDVKDHPVFTELYDFYQKLKHPAGQIVPLIDQGHGTERFSFFLGYDGNDFVMIMGYDLGHGAVQGTMTQKYNKEDVLASLRLLFLEAYNFRVDST